VARSIVADRHVGRAPGRRAAACDALSGREFSAASAPLAPAFRQADGIAAHRRVLTLLARA